MKSKLLKIILLATLLLLVYGCKDPNDNPTEPKKPCKCKQHDFGDTIPSYSETDYNSCMTILKKYTYNVGCDVPRYPFLDELGTEIKVCGWVTELGNLGDMGNNGFFLADDTVFNYPEYPHLDRPYLYFDHLSVGFSWQDLTTLEIHDGSKIQEHFYTKYDPEKRCYIKGKLNMILSPTYMTCNFMFPLICITDTTDYYFE